MERCDLLLELKAFIDTYSGNDDLSVIQAAYDLLANRTKDYEAWANEIGVHTCATCTRCSDNRRDHTSACPMEEHYAVPKDGYCHLWSDRK